MRRLWVLAAIALLAGACGGGDDDGSSTNAGADAPSRAVLVEEDEDDDECVEPDDPTAPIAGSVDEQVDELLDCIWLFGASCRDATGLARLDDLDAWVERVRALGLSNDDEERLVALLAACNYVLHAVGEYEFDLGGGVVVIGDAMDITIPLKPKGEEWVGSATGTVEARGYERGGELIDVLGQGLGAAAGVDVPNEIASNDYVVCDVTNGTGTATARATDLLGPAGPVVHFTLAPAADATLSCNEPWGTFPMTPFITDMATYVEMPFPGATDAALVLEGWEHPGSPIATKEATATFAEAGASLTITWQFAIDYASETLPTRP